MAWRIKKDLVVDVTTTAKDVNIGFQDFLMANNSESVVYFREKTLDGKAVTAKTGFALQPKSATPYPMTADTLSIIGSAAADVRILFVGHG